MSRTTKKNLMNITYFTFILFFITSFLSTVYLSPFPFVEKTIQYLRYLSYILLLYVGIDTMYKTFKLQRFSIKECFFSVLNFLKDHLMLIIVGAISVLVFIRSRQLVPIIIFIFGLGLFHQNENKMFRLYLYCLAGIFMITVLLNAVHIIPSVESYREFGFSRDSLGYIFPLETQSVLLYALFGILIMVKKKYLLLTFVLLNIINYLIFAKTNSRFSFILFIGISIVYVLLSMINFKLFFSKHHKAIKILSLMFLIFCFFIVPALCYFYNPDNSVLAFINKLSSNRLNLAKNGIDTYGFSLLGQKIKWIGFGDPALNEVSQWSANYNFVDCSYIKDLLDYGILYYLAAFIIYLLVCFKLIMLNKSSEYLMLLLVLVLSVSEPRLLQIAINPVIVLFAKEITISNKRFLDTLRF